MDIYGPSMNLQVDTWNGSSRTNVTLGPMPTTCLPMRKLDRKQGPGSVESNSDNDDTVLLK
jgi:hypothetical protein